MAFPLSIDHRRMLLKEAPTYFSTSLRFVTTCCHTDKSSHVPLPDFQADVGTWKGEIRFVNGAVLSFRDLYWRRAPTILERVVNYDFRQAHSPELIFRIDAHGLRIGEEGKMHLDLPDKICYEDGDPRLKGYSLELFTMVDMVNLISLHIECRSLPWE